MRYIVYVKTDEENRVTDINSSAFISDTSGWTEIDNGDGDRYHHAQGNYLPKPLFDEYGQHNFRLMDGVVAEISESDKPKVPDVPVITDSQRMDAMECAIEEIINILMEG